MEGLLNVVFEIGGNVLFMDISTYFAQTQLRSVLIYSLWLIKCYLYCPLQM